MKLTLEDLDHSIARVEATVYRPYGGVYDWQYAIWVVDDEDEDEG